MRDKVFAIDKARQLEQAMENEQAILAFRQVINAYPDSKAAHLSAKRISQLESKQRPGWRKWSSKNGKFSIEAEFVEYDGTRVRLRKNDGKLIEVLASSLSEEDLDFVGAH